MTAPKVEGDTPTHSVAVDWDGTAVPAMWPERPTDFMPGFVENMRRLNREGVRLFIHTARISPWDPWTGQRRDPMHVFIETQYIRDMLDRHGLGFIDIWTREGKPGASVYVDDKAERYTGRPGSWTKVTDKILLRLGKEEAVFPSMAGSEEA